MNGVEGLGFCEAEMEKYFVIPGGVYRMIGRGALSNVQCNRCDLPHSGSAVLPGGGIGVIKRRFVALDRDGTIIVKHSYLTDPDLVELLPGTAGALRSLRSIGLGLVIITNQSAIGRGLLDHERLATIHQRLIHLLLIEGVTIDSIYYCPHTPEDLCLCRKPQPGLMELAAKELKFDPEESFVVGDNSCDIELGKRVKATTILVKTGEGGALAVGNLVAADYIVEDISEAARIIESRLTIEAGRHPSAADQD